MDVEPVNFGIADAAPGAYRLKVRDARAAVLFEITDGGEMAVVTAIGWTKLSAMVERDWSERLTAANRSAGRTPVTSGEVVLHRQFGRELDVLLTATSSPQEADEIGRLWSEATPDFRLRLWKELVRQRRKEIAHQTPQWLQEELRFRAPDGSDDPEREARIWVRRAAATRRRDWSPRSPRIGIGTSACRWRSRAETMVDM